MLIWWDHKSGKLESQSTSVPDSIKAQMFKVYFKFEELESITLLQLSFKAVT
jgi:hypothetical protein